MSGLDYILLEKLTTPSTHTQEENPWNMIRVDMHRQATRKLEGEYSDDTDIHVLFVFILHNRHVATEEGGGGSPFIVRNIEIYTLYIYHTWALNCILSFKPIGPSILPPPFPHFLTLREKNPDAMFRSGISYIQPK